MAADGSDWVKDIAARAGLTAGSFIVTLFGDVVEPRGGRLATASIIDACARVELNATQVRTALSRLVAAGRLEATREGRRSHYRLTSAGRAEFLAASRAIFAPTRPKGWVFVWTPPTFADAAPAVGARRIGPDFWIAPEGAQVEGALLLAAAPAPASPLSRAMAQKLWPLAECEASYAAFEILFAPLERASARRERFSGESALMLRLLLTHSFRAAALRDPLLPRSALPEIWRGDSARRTFAAAYLALSPSAELAIARNFSDGDAALPAHSETARARANSLGEWLDSRSERTFHSP